MNTFKHTAPGLTASVHASRVSAEHLARTGRFSTATAPAVRERDSAREAAGLGSRSKGTSLPGSSRKGGGDYRKSAPLRSFSEPNRWERMDWLREKSVRRSQKFCGMSAAVDEITVQRSERGVHFGGLLTCGSRTCPNCGPRIAAQTRTEIDQAIKAWTSYGPERRLWFGTFTIRHTRGQSFTELAAAVSKAWGAATGGRGWMKDREEHGIGHTLRIFEQKWSQKNGWHIHVHVLFFLDDAMSEHGTDHKGLLSTMFKRWASKAAAMGFGVPLLRAQDLHGIDGADALDRVADYFAKETTDASNEHPGSISAEMTNSEGKQGITSLTPGQILAWAIAGEDYISQLWGAASIRQKGRHLSGQEYAIMLYREFEEGMKNRRTIAWSHGMRDALGLGDELTDEQMAEKQEAVDNATAETLVSMSGADWQKLNIRPGRRAELYTVAQTLSALELVDWLAGYGVTATPHRRDRDSAPCSVAFEYSDDLPF